MGDQQLVDTEAGQLAGDGRPAPRVVGGDVAALTGRRG
jgi:hypothetical protein